MINVRRACMRTGVVDRIENDSKDSRFSLYDMMSYGTTAEETTCTCTYVSREIPSP